MSRLSSLCRNLVNREQVNRDLDAELRAMLELMVDEKIRAGMSPDEARRAATIEFEMVQIVKEKVRDARAGIAHRRVLPGSTFWSTAAVSESGVRLDGGTLGVRAAAGRLLSAGDSKEEGAAPVLVLSHRFWHRRFNGNPAVVGQTVIVSRHAFTAFTESPRSQRFSGPVKSASVSR
jgi:hypothetical protein